MVTWIDHQYQNPPYADGQVVAAIEAELGVSLPADYRLVAQARQGATPDPCVFRTADGVVQVFNSLFALDASLDEQMNVVTQTKNWAATGLVPPGLVMFADTPGGDCLAFDYGASAGSPSVVYVPNDGAEPPARFVASSFSELLGMLRD